MKIYIPPEQLRRVLRKMAADDLTTKESNLIPFPAAHQAMVRRELASVRNYDDWSRFRWLNRVVRMHRSKLRKLGVAPALIDADVAALMKALGLAGTKPWSGRGHRRGNVA